ncbi:MAG: hypothetical protein RID91_03910 [Azospirillaceae bacterium]
MPARIGDWAMAVAQLEIGGVEALLEARGAEIAAILDTLRRHRGADVIWLNAVDILAGQTWLVAPTAEAATLVARAAPEARTVGPGIARLDRPVGRKTFVARLTGAAG